MKDRREFAYVVTSYIIIISYISIIYTHIHKRNSGTPLCTVHITRRSFPSPLPPRCFVFHIAMYTEVCISKGNRMGSGFSILRYPNPPLPLLFRVICIYVYNLYEYRGIYIYIFLNPV